MHKENRPKRDAHNRVGYCSSVTMSPIPRTSTPISMVWVLSRSNCILIEKNERLIYDIPESPIDKDVVLGILKLCISRYYQKDVEQNNCCENFAKVISLSASFCMRSIRHCNLHL